MKMHARIWATLGVLSLGASAFALPAPAGAVATPSNDSPFSGYAAASTLHVNAVQTAAAGPVVENTSVAFSGAATNSKGLATPLVNEMGLGIHPANADREGYGRGSGLEAGLGTAVPNNPNANQVVVPSGGIAEAKASPLTPSEGAPNPSQTALVTKELLKQNANPAAFASVLRGQALATWNDSFVLPMLGSPLGFGLGYADDVQLLNAGAVGVDGRFTGPVIATDTTATSGERTTSQSFSTTYLVNNGDGTCGLASETRQTIAPVRLNLPPDTNPLNDIVLEFLGEMRFKVVATGKPGGGSLTYSPVSGGPAVPILRLIQNNAVTQQLTTEQLFGAAGLVLPGALAPVISLAVGEDPRAISAPTANPDPDSKPTITDTLVSGAADVLRLRLLQPGAPAAGLNALDLRLGHMEAKVQVPAGGINCEIPVIKTATPDPAKSGDTITFTITVPSVDLTPFPCELTAIKVEDTVGIESGSPIFTVTGGTGPSGQKGVVNGNTVTFDNIGSYTPGGPALKVTVDVKLDAKSPAGRLNDLVKVTATPANCKARADALGGVLGGNGFFGAGGARLTGGAVTGGGSADGSLRGDFPFGGPTIEQPAEELPKTGIPAAMPLAGLGLAGAALAASYLRRRQA